MSDPVRQEPVAPARILLGPLERFLRIESASGVVLIVAAIAALAWVNSPWSDLYDALWHAPLTLGLGQWVSVQSLHFWINEGLMTIFFLVVGLEVRREIHEGALSRWRHAALPVVAALGGVVTPALLYIVLNHSDPVLRAGWAIPTATDIAFAVGVLTLLGSRVPAALRAMLLALAIIDDIAAIIIIALFYSGGVSGAGLALAAAGVALAFGFQWLGIRSAWLYVVPGFLTWVGMLIAGVHPAIAGVAMGLIAPVAERYATEAPSSGQGSPARRVETALHPWVAYGVMPLFAFANAGVDLSGMSFDRSFVTLAGGVIAGLVMGKPLGIAGATALAVRLRLCELPAGIDGRAILVLGCLGGIGFTMSIFISGLSFDDEWALAAAKFGVLVASTVAAVLGIGLGRMLLPRSAVARHSQAVS
jgi:NhaA family Na+:H+ antiporter